MQPLPFSRSERRFCDDAGLTVASENLVGPLVSVAVISQEVLAARVGGPKAANRQGVSKGVRGRNRGGAGVVL
jgi:hypothetical protein